MMQAETFVIMQDEAFRKQQEEGQKRLKKAYRKKPR